MAAVLCVKSPPVPSPGGAPTEACGHRLDRRVSSGGSCCLLPACLLGNPGQLQPLQIFRNILKQRLRFCLDWFRYGRH